MADQIAWNGGPGTAASTALDRQTDTLLGRLGTARSARIPTSDTAAGDVKSSAKDGKVAEENRKIEKSARDFESILLGTWLQQAEKSFAQVPGGDGEDEDADPGKDQLQEVSVQSLAGALTASGGIGLAKMISAQLKKSETAQVSNADLAATLATTQPSGAAAATQIRPYVLSDSPATEQTEQTADRRYVR
jgi:Rod binding domain-containing protein